MKDPRNSRTCKAIVKAFKELLEEKDYEKISISDITRRAEINRKTFYYHFTDIHDLVVWAFDNEAVEHMNMLRQFSGDPLTGVLRIISVIAAVMLLLYLWVTRVSGGKNELDLLRTPGYKKAGETHE